MDAFSEIASLGRTGSWPSSTIFGMIPEVESVMRRGDSAMPSGSVSSRVALITLRQIQQRLAHSHHHDVEPVRLGFSSPLSRDHEQHLRRRFRRP